MVALMKILEAIGRSYARAGYYPHGPYVYYPRGQWEVMMGLSRPSDQGEDR